MKVTPLAIPDALLVIEPKVFGDDRGFFFESFNQARLEEAVGKPEQFVQDNHSRRAKGMLRGLHCRGLTPPLSTKDAQRKTFTDAEVFA